MTVLMTADTVGGVWSYTLGLCAALPEIRFVVATLGPRPSANRRGAADRLRQIRPGPGQAANRRGAADRLGNIVLVESVFRLEWMAGGIDDVPTSCGWLERLAD